MKKLTTTKLQKVADRLAQGLSQEDAGGKMMDQSTVSRFLANNTGGFRDMFIEALNKAGATPDRLAQVAVEGLEATQVTRQGDEVADYRARKSYLDFFSDTLGLAAPKQIAPSDDYDLLLAELNITITDNRSQGQGGDVGDLAFGEAVHGAVLEGSFEERPEGARSPDAEQGAGTPPGEG